MKSRLYLPIVLSIFLILGLNAQNEPGNEPPYGNNAIAGQYLELEKTQIYFETYGSETNHPLLLIHGNGGSIRAMQLQIEFFKDDYFVIVGDNRTHGKSGGSGILTYDIMAKDYISILDKLDIYATHVLGHSDGGIIGLLLAINYPDRISKLVAAAPNLIPGEEAIAPWELEFSKQYRKLIDSMIQANDQSRDWKIEKTHMNLMKDEPNIKVSELARIECPVLIMTSDDDIIKPRHILQIYENIPNAQLFMMPGATHFMIRDEHELYNMMSERFFTNAFRRPRSKDVLMEMIGINTKDDNK